jgi:hypothetical protein
VRAYRVRFAPEQYIYAISDVSMGTFILSNLNAVLSMAAFWSFVIVAVCSWWNRKYMLKPLLMTIIPFYSLVTGVTVANRVMKRAGCSPIATTVYRALGALSFICACRVGCILQNHCRLPWFAVMFTMYVALLTLVTVVYELVLFPIVLESDDMMKLISMTPPLEVPGPRGFC